MFLPQQEIEKNEDLQRRVKEAIASSKESVKRIQKKILLEAVDTLQYLFECEKDGSKAMDLHIAKSQLVDIISEM
ncbi:MAG: hypothetical protein F6K45_23160 [Kamptonema sp. SIO1D9]|nr:hypothetical protein [Kamptonema sp. SIO1D9]